MRTERTHAIGDAPAGRTLDAAGRARRAIRELDRQDGEVKFAAVAHAANVSRVFLYSHAEPRRGRSRAARPLYVL